MGLQERNQKEKEVDPFAQLGSPGKKSKVGSALRSQYNFGEGRITSSAPGKLVSVQNSGIPDDKVGMVPSVGERVESTWLNSSANGIPLFYGPCLPRSGYCV